MREDARTLYYLGKLYKRGKGVETDARKAVELWERATELGHTAAALELLSLYFDEEGGKDYEKAAKCRAKRAEFRETPKSDLGVVLV